MNRCTSTTAGPRVATVLRVSLRWPPFALLTLEGWLELWHVCLTGVSLVMGARLLALHV
jgi:hypothetical protein